MTKRFGFHSNSCGADEIKGFPISIDFITSWPISIDFQAQEHGVVTPV